MARTEPTTATSRDQEEAQKTTVAARNSAPDFAALEAFTRQLPETDGVPLESPWHFASINLLIDNLTYLWRDRNDFFCGGNMFVYYSLRHVRNEDFKGPDFFYVSGVDRQRPREFWVVWEEDGKYPDLIIELLSHSTARADRTTKKELYEKTFHTQEYYCYDPYTRKLEGWDLVRGQYQAMVPNDRGWLWSNVLQLWLGEWVGQYQGRPGTWLRFYDSKGQLVPIKAEAVQQKAESELLRADAEQRRAELAEAELARLKASLAQKGIVLETPEKPT
jgi:Uma2 family endonuclease